MRKFFLLAGIVFISGWATAQGNKIVATKSGRNVVITHKVAPKEGLYAIARAYNVNISDLAAANKLDKNAGLNIGQVLKIPIKSLEETRFGTGAPVYYVVEGRENLKSVSNLFAKMPVKNIRIWNDLKDNQDVKKGQEIIVGYLPKGVGSPEEETAKKSEATQPAAKAGATVGRQAVITGSNINIRKGPSTDQEVVGTAQQYEIVDVLKKVNDEWSSIRTSGGVEGFIASEFLQISDKKIATPTSTKSNTKGKKAVITGTNINIRKGPSTDNEVVAIAQLNDEVDLLKNVNNEWASIRTKDGVEGYMALQFLQTDNKKPAPPKVADLKKAKVYGTNINIRKGPSTDQEVVGIAQQDDVLMLVKNVNSEWAEIRMDDGNQGYIASKFLSLDGKPSLAQKEAEQLAAAQAEEAKRIAAEAAANEKAIAEAKKKEEDEKAAALVSEKITAKNTNESAAATPDETGYFKADYEKSVNPNFTSEKTFASGIFKTDRGWNDGKYYILMDGAAPGSLVKITNPANNKMVYAKVLGKMEGVQYSEGFDVRISEAAARKIQTDNTDKFNVMVTY
ncbi:SH3 domain-containing protein [Niabella insulamsoli]|uniref:SH3 domain-containing protein n=1 Tax=Niabella insulamsoli TaxID=3144874 RepID=UPI0031FBCA47